MIRAFIAIDLPSEIKAGLREISDELSLLGAKPVGIQNLHISVLFLGDVPEQKVPQIIASMSGIKSKSFRCGVDGMYLFPSRDPRIVSCRITMGAPELERLNGELAERIRGLGIPIEPRKFMAHLTLARCTPSTDLNSLDKLAGEAGRPKFEFLCNEIKLKSSLLSSTGAVHKDLFVRPFDVG